MQLRSSKNLQLPDLNLGMTEINLKFRLISTFTSSSFGKNITKVFYIIELFPVIFILEFQEFVSYDAIDSTVYLDQCFSTGVPRHTFVEFFEVCRKILRYLIYYLTTVLFWYFSTSTVSFTDLDQGREILSRFSLPKSMKHSVGVPPNFFSKLVCRELKKVENH